MVMVTVIFKQAGRIEGEKMVVMDRINRLQDPEQSHYQGFDKTIATCRSLSRGYLLCDVLLARCGVEYIQHNAVWYSTSVVYAY